MFTLLVEAILYRKKYVVKSIKYTYLKNDIAYAK